MEDLGAANVQSGGPGGDGGREGEKEGEKEGGGGSWGDRGKWFGKQWLCISMII